jgi:CIC family chloride channel protein
MRIEVDTADIDLTLTEISDVFSRSQHHGLPVLDRQGKLWGIITVTDLDQAIVNNLPRRITVAEIATPRDQLLVAFPDETMNEALTRMARRGLGRLPVVSRHDPDHLLGLIRRADIIRAYNLALSRRAKLQHHARRMRLRNLDGTEFVDLNLKAGDRVIGQTVQEIAATLPEECLLISIRRDDQVLIPHGNTVFQPNDHLTAFVHSKDVKALHHCFLGEQKG